jgi:uncharacterized membrane protein YGL010W
MKALAEHMAFYEACHKHPANKLTHVIGIPMIVYSVLVPMSWLETSLAGFPLNAAMLFTAIVLAYYALQDAALAAGMLVCIIPLLYSAFLTARLPLAAGFLFFTAFFIIGWIFQIIGHAVFEKRRPALTGNLFQLLIGPVFILAEGLYLIGLKHGLRDEIKRIDSENRRREVSAPPA